MQGMHSRVLLARKQLSTVHDCAVSHSEAGSVSSFLSRGPFSCFLTAHMWWLQSRDRHLPQEGSLEYVNTLKGSVLSGNVYRHYNAPK